MCLMVLFGHTLKHGIQPAVWQAYKPLQFPGLTVSANLPGEEG